MDVLGLFGRGHLLLRAMVQLRYGHSIANRTELWRLACWPCLLHVRAFVAVLCLCCRVAVHVMCWLLLCSALVIVCNIKMTFIYESWTWSAAVFVDCC